MNNLYSFLAEDNTTYKKNDNSLKSILECITDSYIDNVKGIDNIVYRQIKEFYLCFPGANKMLDEKDLAGDVIIGVNFIRYYLKRLDHHDITWNDIKDNIEYYCSKLKGVPEDCIREAVTFANIMPLPKGLNYHPGPGALNDSMVVKKLEWYRKKVNKSCNYYENYESFIEDNYLAPFDELKDINLFDASEDEWHTFFTQTTEAIRNRKSLLLENNAIKNWAIKYAQF